MPRKLILLGLLALCACGDQPQLALSGPTVQIGEEQGRVKPVTLEILYDPAADMNPLQVLSQHDGFRAVHAPYVPGFMAGALWVRLRVRNDSGHRRVYLENPVAYVDRIDFYLIDSGRVVESGTDGSLFSRRLFAWYPNSLFRFQLDPAREGTILLRYVSESSMYVEPILSSGSSFFEAHQDTRALQGVYFCIALLILLLNLIAYWRRRNPVFLRYGLYVFATGLYLFAYTGYASVYLWPDMPELNRRSFVVLGTLAMAALGVFTTRFFLLFRRAPRLKRLVEGLIGLLLLIAACGFFAPIRIVDPLVHLCASVTALVLLCMAVYFWISGLSVARFYAFGLAFLLVSVIAFNLFAVGLFDFPAARHAVQIGSMVEMLAFNLAILDRIRAVEMPEEAQARVHETDRPGKETPVALPKVEERKLEHIFNGFKTLLEQEKLYCDEDLTLSRLAGMLGVRPDQLSYTVNHFFSKNFSTFINEYRVREAQRLLEEEPRRTVLNIAFSVGFNSKSSFYEAFQKQTGMRPVEYRRQIPNRSSPGARGPDL